jgi:hypothetical protein
MIATKGLCQEIYTREGFFAWLDDWGTKAESAILGEMKRLKIKGQPAEPEKDIFANWIRIVFGVQAVVLNHSIEIRNGGTGRLDVFDVPASWQSLIRKFDSLALLGMIKGESGRKGVRNGA